MLRPQLREQFMKTNRSIFACVTVAVVFGCSVVSVKADDIFPPPWQRDQPQTTFQGWTFVTDALTTAPDEYTTYNPYGTPLATINAGTSQWSAFYDNHQGVWTLGTGDNITFDIPNAPEDISNLKCVWTQLTWQTDNNGVPVVNVAGVTSTFVESETVNGWTYAAYQTVLPYNPSSEDVIVSGSLSGTTFDLGEVVIDTICTPVDPIPEPSSLALLAVGALSLLYASRKGRLAA